VSDESRLAAVERALEEAREQLRIEREGRATEDELAERNNRVLTAMQEWRNRAEAAERQLVEAREQSERLREALRRLTEWIEREQSAWPRARADEATELIDRYVMPVLQVRDE